ncbi:hypothetical protein J2S55_009693 [Streptosporangium brasiliense]|uniref:Uncharacterized protein n=1 Tax=Streptosporangium brasiliense TaxID=47480 RepID=A0ABT9RPS6_9ACTN|nr:hypothetical protein [Streptosporangium brasiliense]
MMHVQTCYFHDGIHYGPPGCYHETVSNHELGYEWAPGTTAQTPQGENQQYWDESQ